MELFKFNFNTDPTILERGEFINKWDSVMWVERYRETGEFEIKAKVSSGLKDFLPIGTFISHVDTMEVMIVENHEIDEELEDDPVITITGRSLESFLENRFVGVNLARASNVISDYTLINNYTWHQAVIMINQHIYTIEGANIDDSFGNIYASTASIGPPGTSTERTIDRISLLQAVQDLLVIDDLGIKTIRRNTFAVEGFSSHTALHVYRGEDKSSKVIFSWKGGHISGANYLFTNKNLKNCAYVVGRYVFVVVDGTATKYDRRMLLVPADDIDGNYSASDITGGVLAALVNKMTIRGRQALKKHNSITISQADISKTTTFKYRRDFNVGDLVTLDGNFGQTAVMRIVEYAEIEDENGESGHPTLALPGGET